MLEEIKTNFNEVYDESNLDVEYEDEIQFLISDEDEYTSINYNITNDYWYTYTIDEEGEEIEVDYSDEEFNNLDSLTINGIVIDNDKLNEFIGIVLLNKNEIK